jgi:branched-chain amino acid transport system substrate-binding protein
VATQALLGIKGTIDRKAVHDAFKGVKNFRSDMMCGPWYYGPGERHQPNHAGRAAELTTTGFKTIAECYQSKDAELADVLDFEAKNAAMVK